MRTPRFKPDPDKRDAYYHLVTRVVAGEWLLGAVEKEILRKNIWLVAERLGIQVVTYTVMSNHLHVVAFAPKRVPLSDPELVRRYRLLHPGSSVWEEQHLREVECMLQEDTDRAEEWRKRQRQKMSDVSEFMKLLKQRFSIWYNRTHNRFGTFWAERFKSLLLQSGRAVIRTAAYVDTNAIRAGLCDDPKNYRFSGYAEAVAGSDKAQAGILCAMNASDWSTAQKAYRIALFERAARPDKTGNAVVRPDTVAAVASGGGKLAPPDLLACRCRYFTDGAVLGSQAFVMAQIALFRRKTGQGQRTAPRQPPGLDPGLAILRNVAPA